MRKAVVRSLVPICAAVAVSGCGLSGPVALASYAMSGFTLMDQGKTVSDIVLSAAVDQDCAMWRIVQDQPICIDIPDDALYAQAAGEDGQAQLAEIDGKAPKATPSE